MIVPSLPTTLPAVGVRPSATEPGPAGDQLAAVFAGLLALLTNATPARPVALPTGANALQPAQVVAPGAVAAPAQPGKLSVTSGEPGTSDPALSTAFPQVKPAGAGKQGGVELPDGLAPFRPTPDSARPVPAGPLPPEEGRLTARTVGAPELQLLPPTADLEAVPVPAHTGGEVALPARPTAATPPPPAAAQAPAAAQIHVQIMRAVHERVDHIRVRLDPPELGHVEIRLDLGDDSRVRATVSVERGDTLDLLQRDAASLERSLRDAGLRADGGGLSFTLKRDYQEGGGGGRAGQDTQARPGAEGEPHEASPDGQPWRGLVTGLIDISA